MNPSGVGCGAFAPLLVIGFVIQCLVLLIIILQPFEANAITLRETYSSAAIGGVTALFHLASQKEVVIGTKRGLIYVVRDLSETQPFRDKWARRTLLSEQPIQKSTCSTPQQQSFPIYCIDSNPDGSTLFCGAGDRQVAVWNRQQDDVSGKSLVKSQSLGPHTGWVKDLEVDAQHQLVHSIGCNCIETWCWPPSGEEWVHKRKTTIESSPIAGCTLSSDLLCLQRVAFGKELEQRILAGGVDGRIHVWESGTMNHIGSFAAHSGRVNALSFLPQRELVLSGGSDGRLLGWDSRHLSAVSEPVVSWNFGDQVRITALSHVTHEADTIVLVGTNVGEIIVVELRDDHDESQSQRLKLENDTAIYSFCPLPTAFGSMEVLVGHANGICVLELGEEYHHQNGASDP